MRMMLSDLGKAPEGAISEEIPGFSFRTRLLPGVDVVGTRAAAGTLRVG